MGKKKVVQKTEEELIKEREVVEEAVKKEKVLVKRETSEIRIYVNASYNNTIITVTNDAGDVLTWASAGSIGFKGTKKATPFAASKVAETIAQRLQKINYNEARVFIKGIGSGRESAIRSLGNRGVNIISIKDVTPLPHNGCRPPKVRRV